VPSASLDDTRISIAPRSRDVVEAPDPCCQTERKLETTLHEPSREVAAHQDSSHRTGQQPSLEAARDIGWLITVLAASAALWGSWTLFPYDAVGMWAGYWVAGCATVAIPGAMWLRTSLPRSLGVTVTALSGGVLLLLGALRDYPTAIRTVMVAGGAGIILGAVLQAGRNEGVPPP